jgi:hypothetical protein
MLTFNNLTLDDLLARAGEDARRETDIADTESMEGSDPVARAREIVSKSRRQMPTLCEDSAWIDYVEIKFGSNPRIELRFTMKAIDSDDVLIHYQTSRELDVPLSVEGNEWVFTYGVGYDFDPDEVKARFTEDLAATQAYLDRLHAREAAWADALAAEVAILFRKRRLAAESVTARIATMGYPTEDPTRRGQGPGR